MAKTRTQVDASVFQAIKYLNKYFKIRQAILFGSQVSGQAGKLSDIDLAVISQDFKNRRWENLVTVFARLSLVCGSSIEIHPFSWDDLKDARPTNFLGHILKTGKVVYKA